MIDPKKTYKTRDGREVRIYAVNQEDAEWPVHGAVKCEGLWEVACWTKEGSSWTPSKKADYDLIEVRPRIQREVWVNVYPGPIVCELRHTKADADDDAMRNRIACVKLVIDCEEGHGLD